MSIYVICQVVIYFGLSNMSYVIFSYIMLHVICYLLNWEMFMHQMSQVAQVPGTKSNLHQSSASTTSNPFRGSLGGFGLDSKHPAKSKANSTLPKQGKNMPLPASTLMDLLVIPSGTTKVSEFQPCISIISAGSTVLIWPKWHKCELVHKVWFVPCTGVKFLRHGFCETSTIVFETSFKISARVFKPFPTILVETTQLRMALTLGVT